MTQLQSRLLDGFDIMDSRLLKEAVMDAILAGGFDLLLHPLGFYFGRLAVRERTTVRLHYWPAVGRMTGTAITPYHDHVWRLRSCILAGVLHNVLLDLDSRENGDFQVAEINQIRGVDKVVPREEIVTPRVRVREKHVAGEFYDIEPRTFHFTDVAPDVAVVTVVRAEVVVDSGPRTLVPVGFEGHAPSRTALLNSREILDDIVSVLGP